MAVEFTDSPAIAMILIIGSFVGPPMLTLIHELGHATAALVFTTDRVLITLGDGSHWQQSIGRLTVQASLFSGAVGFVDLEGELTQWQAITMALSGPAVSLGLCIGAFLALVLTPITGWKEILLFGISLFTGIQFLLIIIPMHYPSWWSDAYVGTPSDGYRALQQLRK